MSRHRLEFNAELEAIPGVRKAYFQPPPSVKMIYPCIVYSADAPRTDKADDQNYLVHDQYSVTVIDPDPDTKIPDILVRKFSKCTPERNFTSQNLNHYNFTIYY